MSTYKVPVIKKVEEKVKKPDKMEGLGIATKFYKFLVVSGILLFIVMFIELPATWIYSLTLITFVSLGFALNLMKYSSKVDKIISETQNQYKEESGYLMKSLEFKHRINTIIDKLKRKGNVPKLNALLKEYRASVIEPRKKDGKGLRKFEKDLFNSLPGTSDDDFDIVALFSEMPNDIEVFGLKALAQELDILKGIIAKKFSIPMIISFFIVGIFFLLSMVGFLDQSVFDNSQLLFGKFHYWTTGSLVIIATSLLIYFISSVVVVAPTDQAMKFLLGKPFEVVGRGYRFVLRYFFYLKTFPTTIRYLNVAKDISELTGKDAQSVSINISVPYWHQDLLKIVNGIGDDANYVKEKLEGRIKKIVKDGVTVDSKSPGMIGDKVTELSRAFIANLTDDNNSDDKPSILDKLLQSRDDLSIHLHNILNEDFSHLGLLFEKPVITDITPNDVVAEARNKKAVASINVKIEEINAEAAVYKAKATADEAEGVAQAGLIKFKKNAEAVAFLKKSGHPEEAMSMITSLLLAEKSIVEIAPALAGMNISLYQIPGIDEILKLVGGLTNNLPKKE